MRPMVLAKHDPFLIIRKSGNQEFVGVFSCFPDSNEACSIAGFRIKSRSMVPAVSVDDYGDDYDGRGAAIQS